MGKDAGMGLSTVYYVSDLLVRSPSCSCVLNDLMEILANELEFDEGFICIFGLSKEPRLITRSGRCEREGFLRETLKLLPKVLGEKITQRYCNRSGKQLVLQDTGEYLLVGSPLWIENKVNGALCFIGKEKKWLSTTELQLLQLITNQVSQALEKEMAKDSFSYVQYCFNSVLGSIAEGIVICDQQKILYINQTAKTLLEMDDILPGADLIRFSQRVSELNKDKLKGQIYLETAFNLQYPGYFFEMETVEGRFLRFTIFHVEGDWKQELGQGILISDITKHKETEQFKDELLALTSHELRTPLTSIKGNISALLRKDVSWSAEEQSLFLQDVYDECNRLDDLIDKQLDISKIKAGALKLDKSLVTISDLMKRVQGKLAKRYNKPSTFKFFITDQKTVLGIDEQRIVQVLLNLIDNAVKHGPEGVVVEILVKKVDHQIFFTVKDNGFGISAKNLNHIFEKYYCAQDEKPNISSGLGLALCKGLVEAHHGSIWVDSVPGRGSSFHFSLPAKSY